MRILHRIGENVISRGGINGSSFRLFTFYAKLQDRLLVRINAQRRLIVRSNIRFVKYHRTHRFSRVINKIPRICIPSIDIRSAKLRSRSRSCHYRCLRWSPCALVNRIMRSRALRYNGAANKDMKFSQLEHVDYTPAEYRGENTLQSYGRRSEEERTRGRRDARKRAVA